MSNNGVRKTQWSKDQISTLRFIKKRGELTPDMLYGAKAGTIWSLKYQGAINNRGITALGVQVLDEYDNVALAARKYRADLTERVANILGLVRFRNLPED